MRPSVSIALASFNGARYVGEQLESISAQTWQPDELVVIDDGSTDATVRICQEFAERVPFRVKIETNPRKLGYTRNFERALSACSGDVVFLCDQDDVWFSSKIDRVMHAFEANPSKWLVTHDLRYCDADLEPIGQTKLERFHVVGGAERYYVTGMATAVRKPLLSRVLPFPSPNEITHDAWLHECALAVDGKLILDDVLADYRRHGSNATIQNYINSPDRKPPAALMRSALESSASLQVMERERLFEAVRAWLRAERRCLEEAGIASADLITRREAQYEQAAKWARRRLDLLERPRRSRLLPVMRQWLSGGYEPFSGYKSALKDWLKR